MAELFETPRGNRLHIGLYGRRNSGKSSLFNAILGQDMALVSPVAGTTADPVYKAMEIHGIGPVELMDTAGFDDVGELGEKRNEKTHKTTAQADLAVVVLDSGACDMEIAFIRGLQKKAMPVIAVIGKCDARTDADEIAAAVREQTGLTPLRLSAKTRQGLPDLMAELVRLSPDGFAGQSLCGHLVQAGDTVLLVMPQDIQAPRGRLILPQVQVIRDLLDTHCLILSCTMDEYEAALAALKQPPKLIITDSQMFRRVFDGKPAQSRLTSFSVLLAGQKGDVAAFAAAARMLSGLKPTSRVLIAEACTHAPLAEDIGRVKIPRMLRKAYGDNLPIDFVRGADWPDDLTEYDAVIQCGSCMMGRQQVITRQRQAQEQRVPMTNYGLAIAYLTGILDQIDL